MVKCKNSDILLRGYKIKYFPDLKTKKSIQDNKTMKLLLGSIACLPICYSQSKNYGTHYTIIRNYSYPNFKL